MNEAHDGRAEPPVAGPIGAILAELNDEQRQAVLHGDEPLLVIAGAGTGKTATLAHRVAYRIATGTDPGRILLLTFTRRAAAEMLRRVDGILRRLEVEARRAAAEGSGGEGAATARQGAQPASGKIWGGTFHATATRLLRLHGRSIGLDPSFTILDRGDAEDLMGVLRTELALSKNDRRFPLKGTCMDIYSRCVNARESVDQTVETSFPWCKDETEELRRLFGAYVDRKAAQSVLDYDDLLLFWHGLLTDDRVARSIRSRFDHVLVDEYQDTNRLQSEILQMMCPSGKRLTVVGDDAQAIYSFRAATVRNILDFPRQFPDVRMVTLEQNFRSTQPILDATNEIIAEASERHAKNLWSRRVDGAKPRLVSCEDEDEQSEFIIHTVLDHREAGLPLHRQAVLFRASHHSLALELELARRNIPFRKYGGLRFVETAHVKDLMAFLRLAENPRDLMAGTRVLMLLPGVGPKKAQSLMERLTSGEPAVGDGPGTTGTAGTPGKAAEAAPAVFGIRLPGAAAVPPSVPIPAPVGAPSSPAAASAAAPSAAPSGFAAWGQCPAPSPAASTLWNALVSLMTGIGGSDPGDLASQVQRIRLFYAPLLERLYDNARARLMDLEQLEWMAARFPDRSRFLAELALDPPSYTEDLAGPPVLDEDYLILSTMHSAKGLEWDVVFVIHAADGNIPSDMSTGKLEEIEEERRLFYVALTRAKDWLYVCYPLRYYSHPRSFSDVHGYAQLTRFASEGARRFFDVGSAGEALGKHPEEPADGPGLESHSGAVTMEDIRKRLKGLF